MITPDDVPEFPGWITMARAATILGIVKQSVYFHVFHSGRLKQVYKLTSPSGPRVYLLNEAEVRALAAAELTQAQAREASALEREKRKPVVERNRRIKAWGRESGWGFVAPQGPPSPPLVAAYERAHPEDVVPE